MADQAQPQSQPSAATVPVVPAAGSTVSLPKLKCSWDFHLSQGKKLV